MIWVSLIIQLHSLFYKQHFNKQHPAEIGKKISKS